MEWAATPILSSENSCRDSYKTWAWVQFRAGQRQQQRRGVCCSALLDNHAGFILSICEISEIGCSLVPRPRRRWRGRTIASMQARSCCRRAKPETNTLNPESRSRRRQLGTCC